MDSVFFVLYWVVTGFFTGVFLDEIGRMKDEQSECQENPGDQEGCFRVYRVWYLRGVYEIVKNGEGIGRLVIDE